MKAVIRPFTEASTYAVLAFLVTALPLGALEATALVTGWALAVSLAITPLVIPVLIGLWGAVTGLARIERDVARVLLRVDVPASDAPPRGMGFWRRGLAVLSGSAFWRRQAYFLFRFVGGGALAIAELSLLTVGLSGIAAPLIYRWSTLDIGSWHVDTLGRSLLFVPAGIAVLLIAVHLLRPLGPMSAWVARELLAGDTAAGVRPPAQTRRAHLRALEIHAAVAAGVNVALILIWATTSRGYFWPVWTLLAFALPLAIHAWAFFVDERPGLWRRRGLGRGLAVQLGVFVALFVFCVGVWAAAGGGYFWPAWPLLAFVIVAGVQAVVLFVRDPQRRALAERVEVLETTRAGAVDEQDAELRRIERDLHDGAQARLVALGMSLGMAEQKLAADPEAARELVAEARLGVGEALKELRDLARGIHPPVLADRGLAAAIGTLADRTPLQVDVSVDVPERPPAPVETAAYFVAAEALANASKHAHPTRVGIRVSQRDNVLTVEVADDGAGAADPAGGGLDGLRRRIEALDGSLAVVSPPGGPTVVRAQIPCAS